MCDEEVVRPCARCKWSRRGCDSAIVRPVPVAVTQAGCARVARDVFCFRSRLDSILHRLTSSRTKTC